MKRYLILLLIALTVSFSFGFSSEEVEVRELPVIMYHSILKSRTSRYIVSPAVLDSDLAALAREGYDTVTSKELLDYADGIGTLPKRPVLITFDDGYYNNLFYAQDILKSHGDRAVISVVGRFTEDTELRNEADHPNYAYLTWEEIGNLSREGTFEIGNHTYDMHAQAPRFGMGRIPNESDEAYVGALEKDIMIQHNKILTAGGVAPNVFAYPYGRITAEARNEVEKHYRMTLTCNEGVNFIRRGEKNALLHLKRYNREPSGVKIGNLLLKGWR